MPGGKKGAGILRAKPNLHWRKDRGKEPFRDEEQFPWFWNAGEFTGDRVNDVHLTPAHKRRTAPRFDAWKRRPRTRHPRNLFTQERLSRHHHRLPSFRG